MTVSQLAGRLLAAALTITLTPLVATAQQDPLQHLNQKVRDTTKGILSFTLEERTRWEEKYGVNFGKSVNQQDMLSRLRIGVQFKPLSWLSINAMGQDSRIPFYGVPAPNTSRDTMDLQEGYIDLFAQHSRGLGATFGREMLNLGEARLIGSPEWGNVSRTFDTGRIFYRRPGTRLEVLMVSPVRVLPDQFNRPELGERIWGTYDTFSKVWRGASFDAYALRHSQNKPGGWTGVGTLGTNSFGGRFYGTLPGKFTYSFEGVGQTGHIGVLNQRAYAYFAGTSRKVNVLALPLNLSVEYKAASGTGTGQSNSSTFDQLSPANHDKFGHQDLFGWRNLHTLKSLETASITKSFDLNLMYTNEWLASAYDSLYNSSGSSIALSKSGTAGKHVGQELDSFLTYRSGAHLFGAGVGHFFRGEFVENTTAHINPRYFYIFQQYSFK